MDGHILRWYWVVYYILFLIGNGLQLGLYWGDIIGGDAHYTLAVIFAVSAGGASTVALLVEGGGFLVLLIPARIRYLKEKGRAEGREEGRNEVNAEWMAWYARLQEAQAKGRPFDEPPPTGRNGAS